MDTRRAPTAQAERVGGVIEILKAEGVKSKPNWKAAVARALKTVKGATAETFYQAQIAMLALRMKVTDTINLYDVAQMTIGNGKFANGVAAAKAHAKK